MRLDTVGCRPQDVRVNTIDALTGDIHERCAAAYQAWRFTERRPDEKVRFFLSPVQTALLTEYP